MKYLLVLLVSMTAYGQDISFKRGNNMLTDEIDGYLSINCENRWRTYTCYDIALKGGAYGQLVVTNGSISADWVKLQRIGSNHIKGAAFNANTQSTGANFNLWLRILFQRPLLERGNNQIKYTFLKNNQVVQEGVFQVDVMQGEYRSCPRSTARYFGNCPIATNACMDYFRRFNYCR